METEFSYQDYLSTYRGIPLITRAQHLGKLQKITSAEATQVSLKTARETDLIEMYMSLQKAASEGMNSEIFDTEWSDKRSKEVRSQIDKLEHNLGTYKAAQLKKSIQEGHMELANAYLSAGKLEDAIKNAQRAKEIPHTQLTTQAHIYTYKLAALLGRKYSEVTQIVHHAEDIDNLHEIDREAYMGSRAITAIANLSLMNLPTAIDGFLSIKTSHLKKAEEFSSPREIALYIGLLAVLQYNRREIVSKVLVGEIKQILGENPDALFMVEGFANADYEAFNNNYQNVIKQAEIDLNIGPNKNILNEMILDKAMKQYLTVCSCVKISTLAEVFRFDQVVLEKKLIDMIKKKSINHLIDPFEKTLIFKRTQESSMENIVKKAVKGIERYVFERQIAKLKFDISALSYRKNAHDSQIGGGYDM